MTVSQKAKRRARRVPIAPRSVIRLVRLWPHARKRHDVGEIWRIGYYCRCCGPSIIQLADERGNYTWTIDEAFLHRHFEIMKHSGERSVYGRGRPKLSVYVPEDAEA